MGKVSAQMCTQSCPRLVTFDLTAQPPVLQNNLDVITKAQKSEVGELESGNVFNSQASAG